MNKILILDKPAGITSHDACDKVKEILKIKKAGHAGTLDPNVTGVLIIALEQATKALRLFNRLDKEYIGEAHIHKKISLEDLEKAKKIFLGKIKQIPPKRSRVKRQEREREIFEFQILKLEEKNFTFFVKCEAGTYIRKLIDDLGKELKIGMHMTKLRRIKQGPFSDKESVKIEELNEKSLLDLETILERLNIKTIILDEQQENELKQGKFLNLDFDFKEEEIFVALNKEKEAIALVKKIDKKIKPERIF